MLFGGENSKALPVIGIGLSVAWLLLIILFWFLSPNNPDTPVGAITRIAVLIATFLPFGVIWMAVLMANTIKSLRFEAELLRGRLKSLQERGGRQDDMPVAQSHPVSTIRPASQTQAKAPVGKAAPQQVSMELEVPEKIAITPETLIRALNFPDDAHDHMAITAMRTALQDHELARVIRAAQDVITLLAVQEITMDGISPDTSSAAIWRRFASGERGKNVSAIGATQNEIGLEIVTTLLRSDEIFRDSAHHFLRHFDQMLVRNIPGLDDTELEALVDTRSARAFILLGKASGSFGG